MISKEKDIALNENKSLKKKIVSKEKEKISKKKNNFDSHSFHVSHVNNVAPPIDKNEIHVLNKRIDCLGSTLSQCAFNHSKLESLFRKKQVSHTHAHTPWHAHTHHAHTSHMYARVYTCTHCDHKSHLARFCFDRINFINFANKNI